MPTGTTGTPVSSDRRAMPTRPSSSRRGSRLTVPSGKMPTGAAGQEMRARPLERRHRMLVEAAEDVEELRPGLLPRDGDHLAAAEDQPDAGDDAEVPVGEEMDSLPPRSTISSDGTRTASRQVLWFGARMNGSRVRRDMLEAVRPHAPADGQRRERAEQHPVAERHVRHRPAQHAPRRRRAPDAAMSRTPHRGANRCRRRSASPPACVDPHAPDGARVYNPAHGTTRFAGEPALPRRDVRRHHRPARSRRARPCRRHRRGRPHLAAQAVDLSEIGAGRWQVTVYFEAQPTRDERGAWRDWRGQQPAAARRSRSQTLPETDWVAKSLAGLAPVRAGRFLVHGRHDRGRVRAERHRHRDRGRRWPSAPATTARRPGA